MSLFSSLILAVSLWTLTNHVNVKYKMSLKCDDHRDFNGWLKFDSRITIRVTGFDVIVMLFDCYRKIYFIVSFWLHIIRVLSCLYGFKLEYNQKLNPVTLQTQGILRLRSSCFLIRKNCPLWTVLSVHRWKRKHIKCYFCYVLLVYSIYTYIYKLEYIF